MPTPLHEKSSVETIRARFDADVDRFSRLETGQQATIDAPLVLDLVAAAAASHLRPGDHLLDLGCGAGNFTLRLLREVRPLHCHLVDLSRAMLDRAGDRLRAVDNPPHTLCQSDLREVGFSEKSFDAIVASAVLHHLRDDADWEAVFTRLHRWLKPGGRLYVADLVTFEDPAIQAVMWERYGAYLESVGGAGYRQAIFGNIEAEDSPRPLPYQLDLLRKVGFSGYDILHRNSVFACFFAIR
ncbi:MAG TPA: class I SAM-dependent methyltransferase [Chthoniobacteraceae bacterium]|nr:class I SAM-dependent methyltransferase [Chthoniobacteraceae bacterium]